MSNPAAYSGPAQRSFGAHSPSLRWLNLSHSFWLMVVTPANRHVSREALDHLIDVILWRVEGSIHACEFETILQTWLNRAGQAVADKHSVGLPECRRLLIDRSCGEPFLDLAIGIMIHDASREIDGTPIIYLPTQSHRHARFEVCSPRWQALCNDLFFILDKPAHGVLRFDEIYFLTAVLSLASNDDKDKRWLSTQVLTAKCLQLFKESGARVNIRYNSKNTARVGVLTKKTPITKTPSTTPSSSTTAAPLSASLCVTVAMFQRLMLSRGIGETLLSSLINYVQSTLKRLEALLATENALVGCMQPIGSSIQPGGSPRLWQHAVVRASGHELPSHTTPSSSTIAFLLCDAERWLSAKFLSMDSASLIQSTSCDELQQNAKRLVVAQRTWGALPQPPSPHLENEAPSKSPASPSRTTPTLAVSARPAGPIFHMLCGVLGEFKMLQSLLGQSFAKLASQPAADLEPTDLEYAQLTAFQLLPDGRPILQEIARKNEPTLQHVSKGGVIMLGVGDDKIQSEDRISSPRDRRRIRERGERVENLVLSPRSVLSRSPGMPRISSSGPQSSSKEGNAGFPPSSGFGTAAIPVNSNSPSSGGGEYLRGGGRWREKGEGGRSSLGEVSASPFSTHARSFLEAQIITKLSAAQKLMVQLKSLEVITPPVTPLLHTDLPEPCQQPETIQELRSKSAGEFALILREFLRKIDSSADRTESELREVLDELESVGFPLPG